MSESMWEQPAEQVEVEASARGKAHALAAVAGFESFVSTGSSEADVENRLALLAQPIEASVTDATGSAALVVEATAHLREIWRVAYDERQRTAAAKALVESARTGPTIDSAEGYEYTPAPEAVQRAMRKRFEGGGITGVHPDKPGHFLHGIGNWWDGPHEVKDNGDGTYSFTNPYNGDTDRFDEHGYYDKAGGYTRYHDIDYTSDRLSALQKGAPFAGYEDFAACVAANSDKDDPEAYCGKIKHQVEDGKTSSAPGHAPGVGQRCPHCAQYEMHWHDTGLASPDDPGETQGVLVCNNCDNVVGSQEAVKAYHSASKTGSIKWAADTHFGVGFITGKATNGDVYEVYSNPNSNPTPCSWVNYGPKGDTGPNSGIAQGRGFTTMQAAMKAAEEHEGTKTAAFFHHDKGPGGAMGEQSEWDRAAADARKRREQWKADQKQQGTQPVQPTHQMGEQSEWDEAARQRRAAPSGVSASLYTASDMYYEMKCPKCGNEDIYIERYGHCEVCGTPVDVNVHGIGADAWRARRVEYASLDDVTDAEFVEAHLMAEAGLAFRLDDSGHEMAHPYGPKRHTEKEVEAPGSVTYPVHGEGKPGFGLGSDEHIRDIQHKQDESFARQRRQVQREHGITSSIETEAGFVDRMHRFLEREHATGNLSDDEKKAHQQTIQLMQRHKQEIAGDRESNQNRKQYFHQHPEEKGQYQRIAAYDPDAMFPNVPPDKRPYPCQKCGLWRNAEDCPHCKAEATRADIAKGYRGPTFVDWLMHGLLPSGAMASTTAAAYPADTPLPEGAETDVCRTCGMPIVGLNGRWMHDPRAEVPIHPPGSVAGDAHGVKPLHHEGKQTSLMWDQHARGATAHTTSHVFDVFDSVNGSGWYLTISRVGDTGSRVVAHMPVTSIEQGKERATVFSRIGSLRTHAVNESAYGTERYQAQPSLKPRWAEDEWGQSGTKAPWSYGPGAPLGKTLSSATVLTLPAGFKPATATGNSMFSTAAEFHSDPGGQSDEFAQMRTPHTTRPRQHPHPSPEQSFTEPSVYTPGETIGGDPAGDQMAGGTVDYSAPTFEQQVAAKIGGIAHKVVEDNPHLSLEQGRAIAMQAISKHPGMVGGSR